MKFIRTQDGKLLNLAHVVSIDVVHDAGRLPDEEVRGQSGVREHWRVVGNLAGGGRVTIAARLATEKLAADLMTSLWRALPDDGVVLVEIPAPIDVRIPSEHAS